MFIIIIFLILISIFFTKYKLGRFAVFISTLLILYFVFLFITYTPDKKFYEFWIEFPEVSKNKEPAFQIIANYIRKNNLSYNFLHVTFVGIYSFVYVFFVSRLSKNVFICTLLYIPLIFVFYGTQLRYFLGFYVVLLAFYYSYVRKNNIIAIVYFIAGVLCHYSLLFLLPIYFLLKIDNHFFRRIVFIAMLIFASYLSLTFIALKILSNSRFLQYLQGELVSSYEGGLFTFLPFIPLYFLIQKYYLIRLRLNPDLKNDLKFTFLYKMSILPIIYLGIALTIQVIGHRFIMPSLIFPICLFLYKFENITSARVKISNVFFFIIVSLIMVVYQNFATGIFLDKWDIVDEMAKMIASNKYLNYLFF